RVTAVSSSPPQSPRLPQSPRSPRGNSSGAVSPDRVEGNGESGGQVRQRRGRRSDGAKDSPSPRGSRAGGPEDPPSLGLGGVEA
ncbi:unnamed protein product, partial [Discosporangium mesarthrocarpum]